MQMSEPPTIQLIGFAGYYDAGTFLAGLKKYIRRLRKDRSPVTVHRPVLRNPGDLARACCADTDLTIMSGHGGCGTTDAWISDGETNRLHFSEFQLLTQAKIGARGGLLWDACQAGRPAFRAAIEPHLAHQIAYVGVIGGLAYADSVTFIPAILKILLTPDDPQLTADAVIAAGQDARSSTKRRLANTLIGGCG
jgi:hypothetical protein